MKAKVDVSTVKDTADKLREIKNWLAVFKEEYGISDEAVEKLSSKIDAIANDLADVHCVLENSETEVDKEALDVATDSMRDMKNWIAVFKTENDLADEACKVLDEKIDDLAESVANIECK